MVDVVSTVVDDDMAKDRLAAPAEDGVDTQMISSWWSRTVRLVCS